MTIQVLVAAMNQKDHSLPEKMHLRCDAIIGNQCDFNSVEEFEWNGFNIKYLNFAERGVGLNRNNALMRATGDICLFADDDIVYCDDYIEIVTKSFEEIPNADVIIFNLTEKKQTRYIIQKKHRVGYLNYMRYGTARIAIRLKSIRDHGIAFNLCFGGGTEHRHGEDSLFLTDCLKKGLKIYAVPGFIAALTNERESTWNKGYDGKYFRDQGCLYKAMTNRFWKLLCLQDAVRHHTDYGVSMSSAFQMMIKDPGNGHNL